MNDHQLKLKDDWKIFSVPRQAAKKLLEPPRNGFEQSKGRLPDTVGYRYRRGYTLPHRHNLLRIKRAIARY